MTFMCDVTGVKRVVVLLFAAMSGCTLVAQGTTQEVKVTSEPSGAQASVAGQTKTTPAVFQLPKEDHTLVVRREGYQEKKVLLERHVSPWFIGSILTGVIGSVVDIAAGSWKEFDQTELKVVLEALPGTAEELAVALASDPAGAEILIGGVVYGRTPVELRLTWPPGETEKTLLFRAPGYAQKSVALPRAERRLAAVALDPAPVRVPTAFTSQPPGAEVRLAGRLLGKTPLSVDVEWGPKDGPRAVEFSLPGHHPAKADLEPRKAELGASLREVVEELLLKVACEPKGAKILVDGVAAGEAPADLKLSWSLSRAKHVLTFSHPGYATKQVEVLRADAVKPLDVRLLPR
jgi:hypothetical protein